MTVDQLFESRYKSFLRSAYSTLIGIYVTLSADIKSQANPLVFYAGSRSGNYGGTLVKVQRLQQYFPQSFLFYNIVYTLSNASYMPLFGFKWLARSKVPVVLNQNGVFYPAWYRGDWISQNKRMSLAYHHADFVFWQTEFCKRCADNFLGPRSKPGEVLFNAVDITRFSPPSRKLIRPFTFLLTGKINKHLEYRLKSTIEGLSIARRNGLDARLVISGWTEDANVSETLAIRYGVSDYVTYTGPYLQSEAPSIYRQADAYVMTKYLDPCPNTVLEAMSCGLPILYSASGGVPELVGPDAGVPLHVEEDWDQIHVPTADAIAAGMISIFLQANQFSEAARSRALQQFDVRNWIERHRLIFNTLLSNI